MKNQRGAIKLITAIGIILIIVIIIFKLYYNLDLSIFKIILLGMISIPLELFNKKGSDNLTLPLGISIISFLLERLV